MPVGKNTYFESDAKGVQIRILNAVALEANQVVYVEGWLGITGQSGNSGDYIALRIDQREYQFTVPSGLTVNKGDTVYVDTAQVTNHIPADAAYSTSAGAGKIAFFKATKAKDANNVVLGKMLPHMLS
jgi:hypothetical protein